MKTCFRPKNFGAGSLKRIQLCNQIIDKYASKGLRLTLRQLFYQLVTQNVITNQEKSYKSLGSLVSDGRLAGLIDWDGIEDRVRQPKAKSEFSGLEELAEAALSSYRLPRWEGQEKYAELWVEKDALAGVLWPIAARWHVTLMVNRGYSSQSSMYEAAQRFLDKIPRDPVLLYLGDHDPSGEDMVRDVRDRLIMFGVEDIQVRKVALTMDQVDEYQPPPNPAKLSDSRAAGYVEKFGDSSWEVDALPPEVLQELITAAISELVDKGKMLEIQEQEEIDKSKLREAVKGL